MTNAADIVVQPSQGSDGAWRDVPAGAHNAIVHSIEDTGISQAYPESGPQLKIGFALEDFPDEEGNMVILSRWVTQKMSSEPKKSNLWKLAEACGLGPTMSTAFRVATLQGQLCTVIVEIKKAGTEDARPGITGFLPRAVAAAPKRRAAPAASAPATATATASDMGPCVICDAPGVAFNEFGKSLCTKHAG